MTQIETEIEIDVGTDLNIHASCRRHRCPWDVAHTCSILECLRRIYATGLQCSLYPASATTTGVITRSLQHCRVIFVSSSSCCSSLPQWCCCVGSGRRMRSSRPRWRFRQPVSSGSHTVLHVGSAHKGWMFHVRVSLTASCRLPQHCIQERGRRLMEGAIYVDSESVLVRAGGRCRADRRRSGPTGERAGSVLECSALCTQHSASAGREHSKVR